MIAASISAPMFASSANLYAWLLSSGAYTVQVVPSVSTRPYSCPVAASTSAAVAVALPNTAKLSSFICCLSIQFIQATTSTLDRACHELSQHHISLHQLAQHIMARSGS